MFMGTPPCWSPPFPEQAGLGPIYLWLADNTMSWSMNCE
jgi:hypothetical protein